VLSKSRIIYYDSGTTKAINNHREGFRYIEARRREFFFRSWAFPVSRRWTILITIFFSGTPAADATVSSTRNLPTFDHNCDLSNSNITRFIPGKRTDDARRDIIRCSTNIVLLANSDLNIPLCYIALQRIQYCQNK